MMDLQKMLELGWAVEIFRSACHGVVQYSIIATMNTAAGTKVEGATSETLSDVVRQMAGRVLYAKLPVETKD